MEWKRLIIWLSVILIFFAAITISGVTIYYKRPNWLGVQNELADSLNRADSIERVTKLAMQRQEQLKEDTTKRAPVPLTSDIVLDNMVEVTPEQLSYFEKELYNKSEQLVKLSKEKDYTYNSLTKQAGNLKDTIKQLNKNLQAFKDSISKAQADINKKVTESKQTIDKLGNEKKQLEDASKKYADLENQIKAKTDELAKVSDDMKKTLSDNDRIKKENKALLADLAKAQNATKAANSKYDSLQKQYKTLQEQYEKKKDSLRMEGYKKYAAIYNGTKPGEVARILETMDAVHSANILARMQKKKASKVVEVMDPAKAADILKITIE